VSFAYDRSIARHTLRYDRQPMPGTRNLELEAAIVADWHDEQAWAVYADWLQAQGDPLGEFLSLRQAWRANADVDTDAIVHALDSVGREGVLGENFAAWLDARPAWLKFVRRDAFVDEARLGPSGDPRLLEALDALLDSTAARFMRGLRVELRDAPEQQHTRVLARLLAAGIQPALQRLELVLETSTPPSPSAFEATPRQLAGLLSLLPNLEALCLDGYVVDLREGLEHPQLTRLELRNCGIGPLLDFAHRGHVGMPKLREFSLDMMQLAHAGCLAELVDSPLFGRLEVAPLCACSRVLSPPRASVVARRCAARGIPRAARPRVGRV
jgi:uncharacterized protein (TIGR02996 family)